MCSSRCRSCHNQRLKLLSDAKAAADRLAREVVKTGYESLSYVLRIPILLPDIDQRYACSDASILTTLHDFATNKKSGYERESAALAFQSLAKALGPSGAPLILPSLPILFELYMDKGDVVRDAATAATKAILKLFPPESTRIVFRALEDVLEKGKWRTKVGALDAMKSFVNSARDAVAAELGSILPKVEHALHDTKSEVRRFYTRIIAEPYLA